MKKKNLVTAALSVMLLALTSCGGSKAVAQDDNRGINPKKESAAATRVRRTIDPTYKLAKEEKDRLRAAQSATSYLEDVAMENAENAAVQAIASRLETAVVGIRERYNSNKQANAKVLTYQEVQNHLKSYIAQKLSYRVVGEPSVYDNTDKTVTVYVCVELKATTQEILENLYDKMEEEDIMEKGAVDKQKFIEENKEELEKLKNKVL